MAKLFLETIPSSSNVCCPLFDSLVSVYRVGDPNHSTHKIGAWNLTTIFPISLTFSLTQLCSCYSLFIHFPLVYILIRSLFQSEVDNNWLNDGKREKLTRFGFFQAPLQHTVDGLPSLWHRHTSVTRTKIGSGLSRRDLDWNQVDY